MNSRYIPLVDVSIYIAILLISNIVVTAVGAYYFGDTLDSTQLSKLAFVPWFTLSIILIQIYRRVSSSYRKAKFFTPKLGWFKPIDTFFSLFFILAISIVTTPLNALLKDEVELYLQTFTSGNMWINVALTVFAAPLFEEYLFRGIIQRDIAYRWGAKPAILIGGIIFSVLHFNIVQLVPTFIMGLYLGYLYYRTNYSLVTVMIVHSLNNLMSITSIYTGFAEKDLLDLLTDNLYIEYGAYGVCVIIVGRLFYKIFTIKTAH